MHCEKSNGIFNAQAGYNAKQQPFVIALTLLRTTVTLNKQTNVASSLKFWGIMISMTTHMMLRIVSAKTLS